MANFASDNVTGASPEILDALVRANSGSQSSYGADAMTQALEGRFSEIFERDCKVFPVATGTACNALALSCLTPAFGSIHCHRAAHINVDECGAPELDSGGAKLVALGGEGAKIDAATLEGSIAGVGDVHHVQAAAVSISQASECGRIYRLDELAALGAAARQHGLAFHMDGARFGNALVSLGCSPAEMTWKAGADVLSFGATKNGALAAEAVVFFDPPQAAEFEFRRKRGGHLFSKMRFISAQLLAYLDDGLWLDNARHANAMARRLSDGLATLPGVSIRHATEANMVFAEVPDALRDGLAAQGFGFHVYPDEAGPGMRLVAAFNTVPEDVETLLAAAADLTGG